MNDERPAARRAVILAVAVLVSLGTLGVALFLGAWAFEFRRDSLHASRLSRMLEERPVEARVSAGLQLEGITQVASDATDATLLRVLGPQAMERAGEVRAKRERFPAARLYASPDHVYVVFFDADGKAAEAALLKR